MAWYLVKPRDNFTLYYIPPPDLLCGTLSPFISVGNRDLFPRRVNWPGREADHSLPTERVELYINSPIRLHGVVPC
jgi:hypothetical protein